MLSSELFSLCLYHNIQVNFVIYEIVYKSTNFSTFSTPASSWTLIMYRTGNTPKRPSATTRIRRVTKRAHGDHHFKQASRSQTSSQQADENDVEFNSLTKKDASLFDSDDSDLRTRNKERSMLKLKEAKKKTKKIMKPKRRKKQAGRLKRNLRSNDVILITDNDDDNDDEDFVFEDNRTAVKSYTQNVNLSTMHRFWAPLAPNIQRHIKDIILLFTDQVVSSMHFSSVKERLRFTSFVQHKIIDPLMAKLKHVKLPPGITEDQLDQEQLRRENYELQLCYDKNLIMLDRLKSELQKENEALKAETKYTNAYLTKTGVNRRMMQKSLKEAQILLEDDKENEENYIEPKELSRIGGDKQNFVVDSLDFQHRQYYKPEDDKPLSDVLSILLPELVECGKRSEKVALFEDTLNQVHNLLGLLDKVDDPPIH